MWKILLLVFCVALLGGVGRVGWVLASNGAVLPKARPPEWKTETLRRGAIDVTVTATGTVTPFKTVLVGAQISGLVRQVFKQPNDPVKEGEILALLDTELLESERRSADVKLNQTRAALQVLVVDERNIELRREKLKMILERRRIGVERAQSTAELATKNRQRFQLMVRASAINQAELDIKVLEENNAKRDERLAELEVDETTLEQKQIEIDLSQLEAKIEQARADVLQAEAALERTVTNLRHATIVAPIDGVVLEKFIDPGQTIAAVFQAPTLFRIASPLNQVRIDAHVDEADIGKVHEGQTVEFGVDAFRGDTFSGRIVKICLQSESKSNLVTYLTIIEASNSADEQHPAGKLMPGMTANLKLILQHRENVLLLPSAALRFVPSAAESDLSSALAQEESRRIGTSATVYVENAQGGAEPRVIQLGENDGENFEVLDGGLKEGERVITGQKNEPISLEADVE